MEKATEDREDPFLALLAWRNTPSEQLGPSPAQILFGRRTRTNLPTTAELLTTPLSAPAHDALVRAKSKQASYYNRRARDRPSLAVGDTIRTRWNEGEEWRKGQIVGVLPFRSYNVQFDDGTIRRRTSKHVRFSREPPLVIRDDSEQTSSTSAPSARGQQAATAAAAAPAVITRAAAAATPPPAPPIVTRSGRLVNKPSRLNDFVC